MTKAKKSKKYKASESFNNAVNSQNNYWGLGKKKFLELINGKSVNVDSSDSCVKYLIENKHLV